MKLKMVVVIQEDRYAMQQERMTINKLIDYISQNIEF